LTVIALGLRQILYVDENGMAFLMTQFSFWRATILLNAVIIAPAISAATLQPAALKEWGLYIDSANAQIADRASGKTFLWVDENAQRLAKVRAGGIALSEVRPKTSTRLPSALINDWVAAVFIQDAKIRDVLSIVRTYARYEDIYRPNVADSKATVTGDPKDSFPTNSAAPKDRFSMVLLNKKYLVDTAFATAYEVSYVRVTNLSGYSISQSTLVQQIDRFGATNQRLWSVGEGSGIIWRLFSVMRFVERDGGVYVELEAMGLSRSIPGSIRWMIQPIVRRALRASLSTSLRQTEAAVRSRTGRNTSGNADKRTGEIENAAP
jgi:hypothetical protein